MTIRLVHLYTGDDGESHFTAGSVDLSPLDAANGGLAVRGRDHGEPSGERGGIEPHVAQRAPGARM